MKLPGARATRESWLRIIPVFRSDALRGRLVRVACLPPVLFHRGLGDPFDQFRETAA